MDLNGRAIMFGTYLVKGCHDRLMPFFRKDAKIITLAICPFRLPVINAAANQLPGEIESRIRWI